MTAENTPLPQELHPYLPIMPENGRCYPYQYALHVTESLKDLEPQEEALRRAHIIISSPIEDDDWKPYGVTVGVGDNGYNHVFYETVTGALRDTEVNTAMLEILKEHDLSERLTEDRAGILVSRCLSVAADRDQTLQETLAWVRDCLPQDSAVLARIEAAKQRTALPPLQFSRAGGVPLGFSFTELGIRRSETREELAERAEPERQQRIARQEFLRAQPMAAFTEITEELGITKAADVQTIDFESLHELTDVAERLERQQQAHPDQAETKRAIELAKSILDTLTDRVRQLPKDEHVAGSIDYTLFKRECDQLTNIATEDEFWQGCSKIAQRWQGTKHQLRSRELYKEWCQGYIARRELEMAERTLANFGGISPEELKSEHIDTVELSVQHGEVVYDNFEHLIADMRAYFLPGPDRKRLGKTLAADRVVEAVGSVTTASMLDVLNPGGDRAIMDDLENAMREWLKTDGKVFRDPQDYGAGDPYKYSGGMFTGHGISIERSGGTYRLSMEGRGYGYNAAWPTELIDAFAAYVGKEPEYTGVVGLKFIGAPESDYQIEEATINRRRGRSTRETVTKTAMHINEMLDGLALLTGIPQDAKDMILSVITSDKELDGRCLAGNGLRIDIGYGNIPNNPSLEDGVIRGYARVISKEHGEDDYDKDYFFLPDIDFRIAFDDKSSQKVLGSLAHALGVKMRHSRKGWPMYEHGRRGPYNSFRPYAWGNKRYDD